MLPPWCVCLQSLVLFLSSFFWVNYPHGFVPVVLCAWSLIYVNRFVVGFVFVFLSIITYLCQSASLHPQWNLDGVSVSDFVTRNQLHHLDMLQPCQVHQECCRHTLWIPVSPQTLWSIAWQSLWLLLPVWSTLAYHSTLYPWIAMPEQPGRNPTVLCWSSNDYDYVGGEGRSLQTRLRCECKLPITQPLLDSVWVRWGAYPAALDRDLHVKVSRTCTVHQVLGQGLRVQCPQGCLHYTGPCTSRNKRRLAVLLCMCCWLLLLLLLLLMSCFLGGGGI